MNWLEDQVTHATERLLATPREYLGPAGRILVDGIESERAESDIREGEDQDIRGVLQ